VSLGERRETGERQVLTVVDFRLESTLLAIGFITAGVVGWTVAIFRSQSDYLVTALFGAAAVVSLARELYQARRLEWGANLFDAPASVQLEPAAWTYLRAMVVGASFIAVTVGFVLLSSIVGAILGGSIAGLGLARAVSTWLLRRSESRSAIRLYGVREKGLRWIRPSRYVVAHR
jgi:hypothetical protein